LLFKWILKTAILTNLFKCQYLTWRDIADLIAWYLLIRLRELNGTNAMSLERFLNC